MHAGGQGSSDNEIGSAKVTQIIFSSRLNALGADELLVWHSRGSVETVAIGAISWSLAGGYTRDQGRPHSAQSLCLQSGIGTPIVTKPRRISLVLHTGREALDKLALRRSAYASGDALLRKPMTGAGCCACAANRHAAAIPMPAMNSRRRMCPPSRNAPA